MLQARDASGGAPGRSRTIPRLPGVPLLGAVQRMRHRPLETMLEAARLGDVVRLGTLKSSPCFIVSHPTMAETVLKSSTADVSRGGLIREVFGRSMFILTGEAWAARRERLLWAYKLNANPDYLDILVRTVGDTAARWSQHARAGRVFDLTDEVLDLARTFTVRAMFGVELHRDATRLKDLFNLGMRYRQRHRWHVMELPRILPTAENRRFERAARELNAIVYGMIDDRRRADGTRRTFLDELIRARREQSGSMTADKDIRDEVVTMFAVGHLTTGAAMVWTLYEAARRPDIAAQIRSEACRHLAGGLPQARILRRLTATFRLLQEAWRFYPPVWLITRRLKDAIELDGCRLPAGAIVMISPYAIHRDRRWWPNPEQFDPERFSERGGSAAADRHGAFLPFGAGPRVCPGRDLSIAETLYTVATLVARFKLELIDERPAAPWPLSMLSPPDGIWVRSTEINP